MTFPVKWQRLWSPLVRRLLLGLGGMAIALSANSLPTPAQMPAPNQVPLPLVAQAQQNPAALLAAAQANYAAGKYTAARQLWQTALELYRERGDQANQAVVLSNLALAYDRLGQWAEANQAIANSLTRLRSVNLAPLERDTRLGQALNIQGSLQLNQGQAEQALTTWQQAATTLQQAGDQSGVIRSLINQSQALRALGLYPRAKTVLEQVNQRLQNQPDSPLKAAGLLNYGNALQQVGDRPLAKIALDQSLAIAQRQQSAPDITAAWMSLGNLARAQGQSEAAIAAYTQATANAPTALLKVQAQLSHLRLLLDAETQAVTAESQAVAAESQAVAAENRTAALALAQKLQPQVTPLAPSRTAIYARIGLAQSLIKLADSQPGSDLKQVARPNQKLANLSAALLEKATQLLNTAAQQAADLADQRAESFALGTLGKIYENTQQVDKAQGLTQAALALSQVSNAPDIAYRWQWQLGRLFTAQSQTPAAIAAYSEAVTTLSQIRTDLVSSNLDLQFTFRESVEPVYRELVSLLLSDLSNTNQKNLQQAREVIESLQLAELDNYFREACLTGQPTQIDRVDPNAAVIYPIILSDRLEVVVSLPNQALRHYTSTIPQADLDKLLNQARQFLRRSALAKLQVKLAQNVYDLLIRPAEADLQASGVKTLVFVLDGALRNIPMAVLHDGQNYLVEKYSIAFTPSLQLLSPKPLASQQFKVLIGGLSDARLGFTPLPGVRAEVDQIKAEVPTQVLFNENFTSAGLQQQIESNPYPIVHLATHGQFSSDANETFILAWDNRVNVKQLGELLQSREEVAQKPIELLVLSACQTAEGDRRATLGLAGVAVRSGARSTLATLWPVDDEATSLFMTQFYRELVKPGATKAEALRQAQLSLMQERPQPYFWAPFVLVGNWL